MPPRGAGDRPLRPDTLAVRGGVSRTGFAETAEALFLTQGYIYATAEEAEASFAGEVEHYVYSRYGNPTVTAFEQRLAMLEGADDCFATASGMAAGFNSLTAMLWRATAWSHHGRCSAVFCSSSRPASPWGISPSSSVGHDLDLGRAALSRRRRPCSSSRRPTLQDLIDIRAVCDLAHEAGARWWSTTSSRAVAAAAGLVLGADVVCTRPPSTSTARAVWLGGAIG